MRHPYQSVKRLYFPIHHGVSSFRRMTYTLPVLPYDYAGLSPHIDEETMRLHHDKHHQAYIDKANAALDGTDLEGRPVEDALQLLASLPSGKQTAFRNNGGGHANHSLFWDSMSPAGGGEPDGELAIAIASTFGSFDTFKERFEAGGVAQFGSGWTWLVHDGDTLELTTTANQDSPVLNGQTPLLGNDVWEHAYYLTYKNQRAAYLKEWWNVVNWDVVAGRYAAASERVRAAV